MRIEVSKDELLEIRDLTEKFWNGLHREGEPVDPEDYAFEVLHLVDGMLEQVRREELLSRSSRDHRKRGGRVDVYLRRG
jgi:hypothetical protein